MLALTCPAASAMSSMAYGASNLSGVLSLPGDPQNNDKSALTN